MLEFYQNPMLAHQGLLQSHHDSLSNTMSCNGHGRAGKYIAKLLHWYKLIDTFLNEKYLFERENLIDVSDCSQ